MTGSHSIRQQAAIQTSSPPDRRWLRPATPHAASSRSSGPRSAPSSLRESRLCPDNIWLRQRARIGVSSLRYGTRLPRGPAVAIVDRISVRLSPRLADLFEILIGRRGPTSRGQHQNDVSRRWAADGLIAWTTRGDVLASLNMDSRRLITSRTLTKRLGRLRTLLRAKGINPYLVQSSPRFGIRFAHRRPRGGATGRCFST
jgi:hypothetical protein